MRNNVLRLKDAGMILQAGRRSLSLLVLDIIQVYIVVLSLHTISLCTDAG